MFMFEAFFVFVFGIIMGSFLNVVLIRGNTGRSIGGRSACMSCGTQLVWYELIPICSYVWLRGRCRTCGSSISVQYLVVEFISGALALLAYILTLTLVELVFMYALYMVLLFIFVYDIRHTIIPDGAVLLTGAFALWFHLVIRDALSIDIFLAILVSACIAALPFFLLWAFSKGQAMGFGDVKLAAALGMFLWPLESVAFVWLSFVLGGCVALVLISARALIHTGCLKAFVPPLTIQSEIPFGPFLIVAFLLVFIFPIDIYTILSWFSL